MNNLQMENRQATVVDHKLESRPQEGGKRKVIFNNNRTKSRSKYFSRYKSIFRYDERKAEKRAA